MRDQVVTKLSLGIIGIELIGHSGSRDAGLLDAFHLLVAELEGLHVDLVLAVLHDRLEVDTKVGVFLHDDKNFSYRSCRTSLRAGRST